MKRYSLPDARMHRVVESPDGEWVRYEDVFAFVAARQEENRNWQVECDAAREEGRRAGMQEAAEIIRRFYKSNK